MRPSFAKLPKPIIVGVVGDKEPGGAIATIKRAEYDGAAAFDLHMMSLERQYHNYADLRKIITSTQKPVLCLYYRWVMSGDQNVPDEERVAAQLTAIEAGAAGLDITADIFDPSPVFPVFSKEATAYSRNKNSTPLEISRKPEIIQKQKDLIAKVHDMGAEVLMSTHTRVSMKCEDIIALAQEIEDRGVDMVKMVTVCQDDEDLEEVLKANIRLKNVLKVPYQVQCHGEKGRVVRLVGPMLGSMLVFCNQTYNPGSFHDQPLIKNTKILFDNANWLPTKPLDEEVFL